MSLTRVVTMAFSTSMKGMSRTTMNRRRIVLTRAIENGSIAFVMNGKSKMMFAR